MWFCVCQREIPFLNVTLKAKERFARDFKWDLYQLISNSSLGMFLLDTSLQCQEWVLNFLSILFYHDVHGLEQLLLSIKVKCLVLLKWS